ncbi:ROK family protein [Roseateles sp. GG27B]
MAEMLQGHGRTVANFLYVFVGTFVGGGLVLAGHIVAGARGNAGAIGSMPMSLSEAHGGSSSSSNSSSKPAQLLQLASGWQLERALEQTGFAPELVHQEAIMDAQYAALTGPWLAQASRALAMTLTSAAALVELDAVVIDGTLGRSLIDALTQATRREVARYNLEGLRAGRTGG